MYRKIIQRCIVCKKHLDHLTEDNNQPLEGTEFLTRGHYGSAITDTMGSTLHYCNICDDCIKEAKESGDCLEAESPFYL